MLWLTSDRSGLVRLDTRSGRFTRYLLDPTHGGSPAANSTTDLYADGADIWVGAPTGLWRFETTSARFTARYTQQDGLPSTSVLGVLGDALGHLWVSTDNGLSRFDPNTRAFRNYDVFDGLQDNAFSRGCRARAPDGRLFFGGANGFSAFYPDRLADNAMPPPVVLTGFELFGKPVAVGGADSPLHRPIHVASDLVLRHDQSVLRFEFAALDFESPPKNQYAYRLEGFERDWQRVDATRRFAVYTNLDPGDYTFRVKASNHDGVWNEQGAALHVTVLPPWWRTDWFRALCAVVGVLMLWSAYQVRIGHLRHRFEMTLEARVGERTRIARELHDTLLQSFQGLLLRLQTASYLLAERPEDARRTLDSTIEEAASAITEARDAVQGLRTSAIEPIDLGVAIRMLGEGLASVPTDRPPPSFQVVVEGDPRDLHTVVRDEIYRTAAEALRNAFRHAHAARVEVELRYDGEQFRLRVRDDGRGIDSQVLANQGLEGHYGLGGMAERAALIGGTLAVWSDVGAGTEVELRVPAGIAYASAPRRRGWFRLFAPSTVGETDRGGAS
jgi:signal transduction histidine kinase